MHQILKFLFTILIIFFYTILSITTAFFAIILGGLAKLIPIKSLNKIITKIAHKIPVIWASISNQFLKFPRHHCWKIEGEPILNRNHSYILISNHQTWLDILVLGYVFNRKTPVIKFFMKKELIWGLPVLGLSCWLLDYPFLHRYSLKKVRKHPNLGNKDIYITKKSCKKFKEFPITIVNFVEGTRFTVTKHQHQHSPYQYLLKPKSGSTAIAIKELQKKLNGILNVTIHYSRPISFWNYFQGDCCRITVHYELLSLTSDLIGNYYEDREFRCHFQKWLNVVWRRKDVLLDRLSHTMIKE